MANHVELNVSPRERLGKGTARALRREGIIPAIIYGDKKDPTPISLCPKIIEKLISEPGFFTKIFDITVDGKKTKQTTIAKDIQFHPINDRPTHVDFLRVGPKTALTINVPVEFINQEQSPGLKRGGLLNVVRHAIEVECTLDKIPEKFVADVSGYKIGESIHISSIEIPEGVTPKIKDRDFTVATLVAPTGLKSADAQAAKSGDSAEAESTE